MDKKDLDSEKLKSLFRNKDALDRVLEAIVYASDEVRSALLEVCRQIVKEMYELFYD